MGVCVCVCLSVCVYEFIDPGKAGCYPCISVQSYDVCK